jgi:K+-transporting ATPase KdpF subunit
MTDLVWLAILAGLLASRSPSRFADKAWRNSSDDHLRNARRAVAAGLLVYLVAVLMRPERF